MQQRVVAVKRRRWCTWLMWTTRGHLIIKACGADKQQMRRRPAGTSPSLIIISPPYEVLGLHVRSQSFWMCENVIQPWIHKQNNGRERDGTALLERPNGSAKCSNSEARRLFEFTVQPGGTADSGMKTWPREEPFSFLSFSSDPAEIRALYSFSTIPLNSLTLLQPEGFLMNLGQHACIKYAEDGITGSEAEAEL